MGDSSATVPDMAAITKTEAGQEGTPSSIDSTPEVDAEVVQDQSQPQKRKGGRKPVRPTSIPTRPYHNRPPQSN